jgi:hypothetical protein
VRRSMTEEESLFRLFQDGQPLGTAYYVHVIRDIIASAVEPSMSDADFRKWVLHSLSRWPL